MAITNVRVPGGGNTFVKIGFGNADARVAFLANVNDQPGRAVGRATPIHPIGKPYPIEIATPYAQDMGTLTLTVWARWGEDGWVSAMVNTSGAAHPWNEYISKHAGSGMGNTSGLKGEPCDLREVLEAQRMRGTADDGYITVHKYELGRYGNVARIKSYQKCVITDIDATDNVSIETMEQRTRIIMNYTHVLVSKMAESKSYTTEFMYESM